MDIFNIEKRSKIMSSVRSKNTSTELIVRKSLYKLGLRYRLHRKDLPGSPDLVFVKYKTVVFINGCLWHGHNCNRGKLPETNKEYWSNKINKNKVRDIESVMDAMLLGWKVLIIWECSLKGKGRATVEQVAEESKRFILSKEKYLEIDKHLFFNQ